MNKVKNIEECTLKIIHDLKTPIAAQIAALESFLQTTSSKISQEEKDLIELTLNSCNYTQKLVDIYSVVQKLNYKSLELNYENFDVVELIETCIQELKILLKYYNLKILFKNNSPLIISADKLQIRRVIENLISNSINYAYENTVIQIEANIKEDNFYFLIRNKSPYSELSQLNGIFDKYKTISNCRSKNGFGLGLYLSNEIIKIHNGMMNVHSYKENINVFEFKIPL